MSVVASPPALSWEPPPIASLDFAKNCSAAADWIAADNYGIVPTIRFLRSSLPDGIDPSPSSYQLLEWFNSDIYFQDRYLFNAMYDASLQKCTDDVCRALDWQGNADIAGIGMVITYYTEAVFTTIQFAVLAFDKYRYPAAVPTSAKKILSITDAFRGSLNEFLSSATTFAMSMLVASIFENAYSVMTYGADTTTYATLLSMLLPICTLFPVAILHSVEREGRRRRLRDAVWLLLILQVIAVGVLASTTFHYMNRPTVAAIDRTLSPQAAFEAYCAPREDYFNVRPAFKVAAIVSSSLVIFWLFFVRNFLKLKPIDNYWLLKNWIRPYWWILVAAFSLVGMWTYLALFTIYRRLVVEKAGISQQDTRWSFGQVLALATWVPVVADFLYIFIFGSKVGLEGRISPAYKVVPVHPRHRTSPDTEYKSVETDSLYGLGSPGTPGSAGSFGSETFYQRPMGPAVRQWSKPQ